MILAEKLAQSRNDFNAILECEHCGATQYMDYGYDDHRFHTQVIPAIKCLKCNKRGNEVIPEGISDPGYQGGFPVKKVKVEVEKWVKDEV